MFQDKCNILFGNNGAGKTNILEGISLLSKGRGIRNSSYSNLVKNDQVNFNIKSSININNVEYDIDIFTETRENKLRKNIKINNDSSKEAVHLLNSSLSFLIFIPEMERLFLSSPNSRRNFIDRLIYSKNNSYNTLINKYQKYLTERSKILQHDTYDNDWINEIENEISTLGIKIYEQRKEQLNILNKYIDALNIDNEYPFSIRLNIKDNFYDLNCDIFKYSSNLKESRELDKIFGGAKFGPHKSDIIASINNEFNASQLSTGQQKTVVLMILLAQCNYLINDQQKKPIILFDEICSHLDENNRKILLDMINQLDLQFFLTGTEKNLFSFISTNIKFYNITNL
tara:strand:+ start:751 stop:1779 length:1029 start_codon:yes stop_codon:yes gene_type:complete